MTLSFDTLAELLEQAATKFKDNELFGTKHADGSWSWITYAAFHEEVAAVRAGLSMLGVGRGDRVAIVANNRVEWAAAAFASFGLGAIFVPMYSAQPIKEWEYILRDSGAKVVFAATSDVFGQLKQVSERVDTLEHVIGLDLPEDDPQSYRRLVKLGREKSVAPASVAPTDTASLIYTSGTTGEPKGVILTHHNFCSNVIASGSRFEFDGSDRALCFLPWAHSFGQTAELYTFINVGASMAINDEVPNLVANLAIVKPSVLVAVPRIFNRIYDGVNKQMDAKPKAISALFFAGIKAATAKSHGQSLSFGQSIQLFLANKILFAKIRAKLGGRLRFVVSGSAALSTEVAQFIDALGIDVYEGYGLTETSPVVSTNYPGNRKIGSVGKPIPGVTVRIDSSSAEPGADGEIVVAGPNVMQGYYNRPEDTRAMLTEAGECRTGDMGRLDDEGYLYITGRIKEQYKLENGKFVVPSPLEEQLKLSRYIANVMLYGLNKPHNVALVVLDMQSVEAWAQKAGASVDGIEQNAQLRALIETELAHYGAEFKGFEKPKAFVMTTEDFTPENNMLTPSLKLKRRNVLAKYQSALDALY